MFYVATKLRLSSIDAFVDHSDACTHPCLNTNFLILYVFISKIEWADV